MTAPPLGCPLRPGAAACLLAHGAAPPQHATAAAFAHAGTAVPLGFCALGMTLGAYLGGCEGKPTLTLTLTLTR